jgi:hypothetical protein
MGKYALQGMSSAKKPHLRSSESDNSVAHTPAIEWNEAGDSDSAEGSPNLRGVPSAILWLLEHPYISKDMNDYVLM